MKEKYERITFSITRFSNEDVITTSDRNNAHFEEKIFEDAASSAGPVPTPRNWY